jgi:hypothetical protein
VHRADAHTHPSWLAVDRQADATPRNCQRRTYADASPSWLVVDCHADTPGPSATTHPTPTAVPRSVQGRGAGFVPLDDPAFIPAGAAAFLGDDDLVLGYAQEGEARAYPVSMLFWHHIINDTVQGVPLLVTY